MNLNPAEQFQLDFLLTWGLRFIDRPNVRCHQCGLMIWSTAKEDSKRASINFRCEQCQEMICLACGCIEESPCVNDAGIPCSWVVPGFCSLCANQIARFAYLEVTGINSPKSRPYIVSRQIVKASSLHAV